MGESRNARVDFDLKPLDKQVSAWCERLKVSVVHFLCCESSDGGLGARGIMGFPFVCGPAADCAPTKGPAFMSEACWAEGRASLPRLPRLPRLPSSTGLVLENRELKWLFLLLIR